MEVCVPFTTSVGHDISGHSGSGTASLGLSHCDSRHLSVDNLEICLSHYLNIEENKICLSVCNLRATQDGTVDLVREDHKDLLCEKPSPNSASNTCLSKSATFPLLHEVKSVDGFLNRQKKNEADNAVEVSDINEHANSVNQSHSHLISLPTRKLVSAMKGSREKQGRESKTLSVTWAPDVYDPVPTSVSHVPSGKHYRHRSDSKKHSKSKLKSGSSKSSRGKSKDKKQPRKTSGSTSKLRSMQSSNGVGFSESEARSLVDYYSEDLDWDLYCGNTFG